uniref:Lipoyl-binding domain-containing protein n=1 Tax=Davidia involucrata TaxID=16924 RepID=A0A5B7AMQ0_DAVIN
MAACSLGASSFKISNLNLGFLSTKLGTLQPLHGLRTRTLMRCNGLVISRASEKALTGCHCLSSEAKSATGLDNGSEEVKSFGTISQLIPNAYEVESLLTEICDTTSIAEFELKFSGFRLYVKRDLIGMNKPPPPPISAPVSVNTTIKAPDLNGSVSSPSLAITKPEPSLGGIQTFLDKAADEGLLILQSPRVGYFRRSRTIKGKRAPPSCKEKQMVKEGQVLCYIEQLGGELPIESDVSGEVIKILREDGDPVGYGDALIEILPSFPGIKKLQ